MKKLFLLSGLAAGLLTAAAPSFAASMVYSVSTGVQPTNVGTITLVENGSKVDVVVHLITAQYGFLNTGGPHAPFAFNLDGVTGVAVTDLTSGFSLNTGGGSNTPFGSFNVALDKSGGNGSGNAYYGDLSFSVTRTNGLLLSNFVANADGYIFSADLTNGQNTGAQAWNVGTPSNVTVSTPDGGTTAVLWGLALAGLAFARRFGMKS